MSEIINEGHNIVNNLKSDLYSCSRMTSENDVEREKIYSNAKNNLHSLNNVTILKF